MFDELYNLLKDDRKYSNWSAKLSSLKRIDEVKDEIEELVDAINRNDIENIKEEAGDVMWDFFAIIVALEDEYQISKEDILDGIINKMKKRKPFIFEKRTPSLEEEKIVWNKGKYGKS